MSGADTLTRPQAASGDRRRTPVRWLGWRMPRWLAAGRPVLLPAAVLATIVAALLPLATAVVGGWIAGATVFAAVLLALGAVLRSRRMPGWLVVACGALLWVFTVTALFLSGTAVFVIVPTVASVDRASDLVAGTIDQLQRSSPPVDASPATTAVLIATAGLLVVVVDLLVASLRLPVAALAVLVCVAVIPAIPVSNSFTVLTFAAFAAAGLWMLHVCAEDPRAPRSTGTAGATVAIGGIAAVVAIAIAPLIPAPAPVARTPGIGSVSIDGSLNLGTDLRLPADVQVLTVTTSATTAPYLRIATLSSFTGTIWTPDPADGVTPLRAGTIASGNPLAGPGSSDVGSTFPPVTVGPGIEEQKTTTKIVVDHLRTTFLPLPYPATALKGPTDGWGFVPGNRTIVGFAEQTGPGLTYDVTTEVPEPTLEQIDAASATVDVPRDDGVPASTPAIVGQLAEQVTAGEITDYDKLEALQAWFRGPLFTYSLKSPVTHGFDSSGVDAVAQFLKVKAGYCVHFASAFALMARELGMTSRIVIGFLPGTATDKTADGSPIYSVMSSQLHAWPEVYFSGIGWVAFEPTKSLGTPTAFSPAASRSKNGPGAGQNGGTTPHPSSSTINGGRNSRLAPDQIGGGAQPAAQSFGWWGAALVVVLLLSVPGIVGFTRRRREDAAIREGDPVAAWTSVLRVAVDLRIPLPPGDSPRMFGDRLAQEYGVASDDADALVADIERASYAPERLRWAWSDDTLPAHVIAVRRALRASVPRGRRLMAVLFPRSLVVRPDSAAAASSEPSRTR
ncbi:MAG TPA: DUF3488 and transglutaminase-like domain-containing protein [Microbacterium sp.]|uniref:transglutaminase family protein n=1 Tax=Microbacterium sp. TaxID=51671 RepID=UPI002B4712BC|nr:DUF3488 and transglutaminase-like domain-containing protein [Microbacterium sp.]HKT57672.1 DUF3488 and transglutaminase-like domain-containing protein [Microbacterium sp.]